MSWGKTWQSARPVAYDSTQLRDAELNYPVHKKELLAIIWALKKWQVELLGAHINVFTDHQMLQNFNTQRDLSQQQAQWAEYMSQYDLSITYIKGEDNSVADALSRRTDTNADTDRVCAAILSISTDSSIKSRIKDGYASDPWCQRLPSLLGSLPDLTQNSQGLFFVADRLVVPRIDNLQEDLFHLAHNAAGHFGANKTYGALCSAYYWPNMWWDLTELYIPSCTECMRNKSRTTAVPGPLHPLPVPDGRGDSVAIDFVGPLPEDHGHNMLITMTNCLNSDIHLIPCHDNISAEQFANVFFDNWYCENGLLLEIVSDHNKLFLSKFWQTLNILTGVKLKMSSVYHPETDGASEHSNKTINQCLRYHVNHNQKG
jgi:hypothetical protein